MDLVPGTEYAGYRIIRELGRGGMGVVYEAEQPRLKRSVALKVLADFHAAGSEAVTRFGREAEAGGRLHHPNIVQVYETGSVENSHYIAMEFVRGKSVATIVEETKKARDARAKESNADHPRRTALAATTDRAYIEWAVRLVIAVLRGLDHAHKLGVLHRDIKPQNLLLDEDGRIKIADFGLARLIEDPAFSLPGQPHGTPWYMSPEQVAIGLVPIDHRTDVYSTGVTLYELTTLDRPFPGNNITTVFRSILQKEPARPRMVNPRLARDLETIVLKAIDKDPDRRSASAIEFADDLQRFLDFKDIVARPVGPFTRFVRRAARNKALTAVSAALLLAVLMGAIYLIGERVRTSRKVDSMLTRAANFREAGAHDLVEAELRELLRHVAPDHPEATAQLATAERERREVARRLLVEAERLVLEHRFARARVVIERARRMAPDDTRLDALYRRAAGIRTVRIHVEGGPARLHAAEYIQVQRDFAPARLLGTTDGSGTVEATLSAGDYVVTALASDGRFTETWVAVDPLIRVEQFWIVLHPTADVTSGMSRIPAGVYTVGGKDDLRPASQPVTDVTLDEFWIDQKEATQEEYDRYLAFLRRTGQPLPLKLQAWWSGVFKPKTAGLPMQFVSWVEANQFMAFLGKRLPTEAEWEAAARGTDGLLYPWGNEWDASRANVKSDGFKPAGTFGGPGYLHGLYDMIGNIPEWTADRYLPYPGATFEAGNVPNFDFNQRVLRGGSYHPAAAPWYASSFFRNPGRIYRRLGARGARSSRPRVAGSETRK